MIQLQVNKKKLWQRLRQKSRCERCGTKYNLTIDHIRKKEHGGTDERKNLRILCFRCHQRRHKKEKPLFSYYLGGKKYFLKQ